VHSAGGRKAGLTETQLQDIASFEGSTAFDNRAKLVLRLAVALTRTPAAVDDGLFTELAREFSEPQLVELATAIAWENHRSRFNRLFAISAAGYSKGAFCPLPEH